MKASLFLLLVITIGKGALPPAERSFKILMLLPASSPSHRNVFIPLAEALADRGHTVMMISNNEKTSIYPNITEIYHGLPYFHPNAWNIFEIVEGNPLISPIFYALHKIAREIYKVPKVKELYDKRKEFDLIVVDHEFNEVMYPFVHEMPFITISTLGVDSTLSAVLGNPTNPAYVKNYVNRGDFSTISGRIETLFWHIFPSLCWRHWAIVPVLDKELKDQFPDLPPVLELERNQSLTLMNSHFSIDISLPLLPTQIEIGGIHCHPGKPLPKDLKRWIDEAGAAGVVYFSLGSVTRGETMPEKFREMFTEAFGKLKQRVLWKFEGEIKELPKNIKIGKWLPQQDILAHPNVKMFVTHGGGLSILEASYHAVPMLVLPLFGDQLKNADLTVDYGRGLALAWETLTKERLLESLLKIIKNPKYKKTMIAVSKSLRDQPQSPKDQAVFWTEYVIKHKGAPHLRSPAARLSWVEFLLLDVLALFLFIILLFAGILRMILKICTAITKKP